MLDRHVLLAAGAIPLQCLIFICGSKNFLSLLMADRDSAALKFKESLRLRLFCNFLGHREGLP